MPSAWSPSRAPACAQPGSQDLPATDWPIALVEDERSPLPYILGGTSHMQDRLWGYEARQHTDSLPAMLPAERSMSHTGLAGVTMSVTRFRLQSDSRPCVCPAR